MLSSTAATIPSTGICEYIKHNKRLGVVMARLSGIAKAAGKYIAFFDDDDWVFDNKKLYVQKQAFSSSRVDFVMCNYVVNDEIQQITYEVNLNAFAANLARMISVRPGPFLQCCLFQKKFVVKYQNLFDSASEPSEDWDWFISISKFNPIIHNINIDLFQWNRTQQSQSSNTIKETKAIAYIIKKHHKYILAVSSKKNLAFQYRKLAGMYYKTNNFGLAKYYYNYAFQYNSLSLKNIVNKFYMKLLNK